MSDRISISELIESCARRAECADPVWVDRARETIAGLARRGKPFTSEDVLAHVGSSTADNRALGGLFRAARIFRIITPTGRVVPARRPIRNSGLVREWVGLP